MRPSRREVSPDETASSARATTVSKRYRISTPLSPGCPPRLRRARASHRSAGILTGSPMRTRVRVLACVMAGTAVVISGCSTASAPSPVNSTTTTTTAAAGTGAPSSAAGPSCGVAIAGRHRYLPSPPAANAILLLGSGRRGLVLGAQANGDICQVLPFAERERARGYHVAVFDWGSDYAVDMSRATRALLAAGAHQVVVGGFSRGALVALGVAPRLGRRVVGVISISGGPSAIEGFPSIPSLSAYRGPILLVSSKEDPVFPLGTSAAIAAAHRGPEKLLVVPGSDHALALLNGRYARRIYAAIDSFLARVL
jgi:pimeloyl-ACP methyl ester carboxylesterase